MPGRLANTCADEGGYDASRESAAEKKSPAPRGPRADDTVIVVHADWSLHPGKRAIARARRRGEGWLVETLDEWDPQAEGPRAALGVAEPDEAMVVGVDFPIGLPAAFSRKAALPSFPEALRLFGTAPWDCFLDVATTSDQISLRRPFYPYATGGKRQEHLFTNLGLSKDQLLRRCERGTVTRPAACCVFWTLGANQVGKGAISGWRELVGPLVDQGAAVWPFDGELQDLVASRPVVVAETYPAEYYRRFGFQDLGGTWSKRRQADRQKRGALLIKEATPLKVDLADDVRCRIDDGFGPGEKGEDPFDAVVGLFGMLEALRSGASAPPDEDVRRYEGWILGQSIPT